MVNNRATVRFIAEAERQTLEAFEAVLKYRLGDAIYINRDWRSGVWFARGSVLENEGLVSGVTGSTHKILKCQPDGNAILPASKIGVVFEGIAASPDLLLDCWLLTRLGQEVASLLPAVDELTAAQHLADVTTKANLKSIWIGNWTRDTNGNVNRLQQSSIVWQKDHEQLK